MMHPISKVCFTQYSSGNKVVPEIENIDTTLNYYGYRSDDFEDVESNFLFSGCSFGWGAGLPDNSSWAYFMNQLLGGKRFHNLSQSGNSADNIIDNIYRFIRQFGKPKGVVIIFPNLQRFALYDKIPEGIRYQSYLFHPSVTIEYQPMLNDQKDLEFLNQKVFTQTYLEYNFLNRVKQLEEYLDAIGIPFLWSTWTYDVAKIINPEEYQSYAALGTLHGNDIPLDLRQEVFDYIKNNMPEPGEEEYWLEAADKPAPHPGIAEQKYFAQAMAKSFRKKFAV